MATWTAATRHQYKRDHPENFAGVGESFPIKDRADVADAWGLAGRAANPDAIRRRIIAICRRMGFMDALPDTARQWMAQRGMRA